MPPLVTLAGARQRQTQRAQNQTGPSRCHGRPGESTNRVFLQVSVRETVPAVPCENGQGHNAMWIKRAGNRKQGTGQRENGCGGCNHSANHVRESRKNRHARMQLHVGGTPQRTTALQRAPTGLRYNENWRQRSSREAEKAVHATHPSVYHVRPNSHLRNAGPHGMGLDLSKYLQLCSAFVHNHQLHVNVSTT